MEPKRAIGYSPQNSLRVTCDTIKSEQVSFPTSSLPSTEASVSLDSSPLPKKHSPLPSRFANLCVMWFASIAAIGEKPSAATSAADTA